MLLNAPALAQLGPGISIDPWPETPAFAESIDMPLYINEADLGGGDLSVFHWDSSGRVKFEQKNPHPDFVIGYRVLAIDLSAPRPELNGSWWDIAMVGSYTIREAIPGWDVSLLAGAGTANDDHFPNTDALYGIGNINFTHRLDENRAVHLGLNYDGHRILWPDIPLPYVMFTQRVDDQLTFTLGLPTSSITYTPVANLRLELQYNFPVNVTARASYQITEGLSVFVEGVRQVDGFFVNDREQQRLFYALNRVNGGVRVVWSWLDLAAGVGYAFGQEFTSGWDIRDTATVARPGNALLFSLTIRGTF